MCLALPARVAALPDADTAPLEVGGVRQRVSVALLEGVRVNDYVVVHVGYALTRLDEAEAQRTLATLASLGTTP